MCNLRREEGEREVLGKYARGAYVNTRQTPITVKSDGASGLRTSTLEYTS